jgi:hypothetical protein
LNTFLDDTNILVKMEAPTTDVSKPSFPALDQQQQLQQQHPHHFKPIVSPLARAYSNTSLGPVVTPTKETRVEYEFLFLLV